MGKIAKMHHILCLVLLFVSGLANATIFLENPIYESPHVRRTAIAKIGCVNPALSNGYATATHLGNGWFLGPAHKDWDNCRRIRIIPKTGVFKNYPLIVKKKGCQYSADVCVFHLYDPYFQPETHFDISIERPKSGDEVSFIGFVSLSGTTPTGESPPKITIPAGNGKIALSNILVEHTFPRGQKVNVSLMANSLTWYNGGSNSPVFNTLDPSLMVLYQAFYTPKQFSVAYESTLEEAIDFAERVAANEIEVPEGRSNLNFNYGVPADLIAKYLLANKVLQPYFKLRSKRVVSTAPFPTRVNPILDSNRIKNIIKICKKYSKSKTLDEAVAICQSKFGIRHSRDQVQKALEKQ